jgi:endonuclease G
VVAFLSDDGKPSATAYIISQEFELGQLEAAFGKFKTYQCSVLSIEQKTGIDFGNLSQYDGLSNEERNAGQAIAREIKSPADILV